MSKNDDFKNGKVAGDELFKENKGSKIGDEIIEGLKEISEAIKKKDLTKFRTTTFEKNPDGSITRIVSKDGVECFKLN